MEEQQGRNRQLTIIKKIGNGCQGQVFQVCNKTNMQRYALKIIQTSQLQEQKERQRIQFQIQSNLFLSNNILCPYFPRLYHYWIEKQQISFLFELCDQNSEAGFKKLTSFSQRYNYLLVLLFDGLQSLSVLQKLNIIHRDIKPENILRKEDCFKMADLGLSRIYQGGNTLTNNIGNKLGRSPEFITGSYSTKSDVWSLGIHIFYLLQNTLPFDDRSMIKIKNNPNQIDKVISSKQLQINFHPYGRRSKNVLSFIHLILTNMIVIHPECRFSSSNLLNEYFSHWLVQDVNIVRLCLFNYLKQRNSLGRCYLMVLLAYTDYQKANAKIRGQPENTNKIKICMKVKNCLLQLVSFLQINMILNDNDLSLLISRLLSCWLNQCKSLQIHPYTDIDQALQIYRISKVRQKFTSIQWIVRLYKGELMLLKGAKCAKITLWDIPIDLYKLL